MFKNVSGQIVQVFAFTLATGAAKTGDAANITAYAWTAGGSTTVLGDTSATEVDATNAPGWYMFDLTQAETNFDYILFTGKSSTSGVSIVGRPVYTMPANFSSLAIDSGGVTSSSLSKILGTALTETSGQLAASFKKFFNIATPASTMDSLTLVATATNLTNAPTGGDLTATMKTSVTTAATAATPTAAAVTGAVGSVTGAVGSVTGNVGGNVLGSVASVTARVTANADQLAGQTITAAAGVTFPSSVASPTNITAASGVALTAAYDSAKTAASQTSVNTLQSTADKLETTLQDSGASPTAYQFTTPALANGPSGSGPSVTAIVNGVWDEPTSGHQTTGTTGKALTSAGSAGDPWSSVLGSGLLTAGDMMLILVAVAAGKTTVVPLSAGSATVTFRDLADTKDSVAATMSGSQRVSVVLNP